MGWLKNVPATQAAEEEKKNLWKTPVTFSDVLLRQWLSLLTGASLCQAVSIKFATVVKYFQL